MQEEPVGAPLESITAEPSPEEITAQEAASMSFMDTSAAPSPGPDSENGDTPEPRARAAHMSWHPQLLEVSGSLHRVSQEAAMMLQQPDEVHVCHAGTGAISVVVVKVPVRRTPPAQQDTAVEVGGR